MNKEDNMAKYRKKPVEIEAFQYDGDFMNKDGYYYVPEWAVNANLEGILYFENGELFVNTLEGKHHANVGDYIIKGVKGELYPCKPDIFEMTYEAVEERKECESENKEKLNKILIRCDGKDIIINTIRNVSDIARLLEWNIRLDILTLDKKILVDEGFKNEVSIKPRAVTLIKYINDDYIKRKHNKNTEVNATFIALKS